MNRTRTVAGLDVHKDSIYLCIMGYDQAIIWENTYGVLTPDLRQMHYDMRTKQRNRLLHVLFAQDDGVGEGCYILSYFTSCLSDSLQ